MRHAQNEPPHTPASSTRTAAATSGLEKPRSPTRRRPAPFTSDQCSSWALVDRPVNRNDQLKWWRGLLFSASSYFPRRSAWYLPHACANRLAAGPRGTPGLRYVRAPPVICCFTSALKDPEWRCHVCLPWQVHHKGQRLGIQAHSASRGHLRRPLLPEVLLM